MRDPVRHGVRRPLSPARRMVDEFMAHAKRVPSLPLGRWFDLAAVAAARRAARPSPSWTALFMKAYGTVARRHPGLRQAYIPYPWPHLYEHPSSECAVLVEREYAGEQVVLGAKLRGPEEMTLAEIDGHLRRLRETPVEEVSEFRQTLRLGRLPWLLRRFTFWQSLYLSGFKRAKRFGTFMISSLGNLGVEQFHPLTALTTYLTYGPIDDAGRCFVKVIYDHRVLDGRGVARVLVDLEAAMHDLALWELSPATTDAA
jgi:hypothetical protein